MNNKINAFFEKFVRMNRIQEITAQKDSLKNVVLDALKNRGDLTVSQRSQVLKEINEAWKSETQKQMQEAREKFLELEEAHDISKKIGVFG